MDKETQNVAWRIGENRITVFITTPRQSHPGCQHRRHPLRQRPRPDLAACPHAGAATRRPSAESPGDEPQATAGHPHPGENRALRVHFSHAPLRTLRAGGMAALILPGNTFASVTHPEIRTPRTRGRRPSTRRGSPVFGLGRPPTHGGRPDSCSGRPVFRRGTPMSRSGRPQTPGKTPSPRPRTPKFRMRTPGGTGQDAKISPTPLARTLQDSRFSLAAASDHRLDFKHSMSFLQSILAKSSV